VLHQLGVVYPHAALPDVAPAEAHSQQGPALAEELGMRSIVAHPTLSAAIELYRAMDMAFWLPQAEAALAQPACMGQRLNSPSALAPQVLLDTSRLMAVDFRCRT